VSGARTEEPTPRRLREARRRGEWPRSREWTGAVALAAGLAAVALAGPGAVRTLSAHLRAALAGAATGDAPPLAALGAAGLLAARLLAPLLLAPALAAAAAAALQSGALPSPTGLAFRPERLSPAAGLRRLASAQAWGTAALGLAKAALLLGLLAGWLAEHARALAQLPRLGATAPWRAVPLGALAGRLAFAAVAIGALDLALAHRRHRRSLRMTREEVRREAKEDEGDPQHRAERRRIHRALAEAGPVEKATVVVVNPTHVAVALLHRKGGDDAPLVLAKGTGAVAARIRSAARRAGVPVVRDVPLARSLHRLAEVGDRIPAELYEAAATVLVHVHGLVPARDPAPGARPEENP
jgi:type III secretion protein U